MGNFENEKNLILQFNLPSKHWKKRRIKTAYDKKIRRLDKECNQIEEQIRNLGYTDLLTPIQRGYKRLFVLSEETRYSKQADFYQGILDKINTIWYSPYKTFKQKKRRIKKWKYKVKKEQKLQEPSCYHFNKKFTEEEKSLFYKVEFYHYPSRKYYTKYMFTEKWRFVLKVMPNMITKIKIRDVVLEQKRDELIDFLSIDKNIRRKMKMKSKKNNFRYKPEQKFNYNPIQNKQICWLEQEYNEEKLIWR